jgi:hypothetical protein
LLLPPLRIVLAHPAVGRRASPAQRESPHVGMPSETRSRPGLAAPRATPPR